MLRVVSTWVLLCCLGGTTLADGRSEALIERARGHFRAGDILYRSGNYAEALQEFNAGYELAPRPEFLLNLGQVHRKLHDPKSATTMFERFLASTALDDPRRREVEEVLAELRAERAPAPAERDVAPRPPTITMHDEQPRWYRDAAGWALAGSGLALVATGGALTGYGDAVVRDAQLDLDHYARAETWRDVRTGGIVILAAGGALALGGVIRFAVVARRRR